MVSSSGGSKQWASSGIILLLKRHSPAVSPVPFFSYGQFEKHMVYSPLLVFAALQSQTDSKSLGNMDATMTLPSVSIL